MARQNRQTNSVAGSYWWVPIAVALLAGVGWFIRDLRARARTPGKIVAYTKDAPGATVTVRLDNDENKDSTGGFIRFPDVQPGPPCLGFWPSGYQTVRIKPIIVKGGKDNFIDFPAL